MDKKTTKKNLILGILFFLPVVFVFIMSISSENYETLDIVKSDVTDILPEYDADVKLKEHLTVLAFFGKHPMERSIEALNLKEIVYDKFKGFKKFQIVVLVTKDAKAEAKELFQEIASYEDLRFWHFVHLEAEDIQNTFRSLKTDFSLDANLSTDKIFVIDTDLNQRGRIDARADNEKGKNSPVYDMNFYSCIEVAELKNKLASEDLRVLFTEYRQKRKGDFNSDVRRADDLKAK
ncbi:hypothetical protein [Algibacter sp. 2305UL17-15]|uniref:hypothetical protein n=1 Tax=Algibacter sp. 2305UL17-15 TaxID=3231268 RepID=UPI003459C2CC